MENVWQIEKNLLKFRGQVTYSQQNHEMTGHTNHSDWKNESADSAPDTKSAEQSYEHIFHAKKSLRKERKWLSVIMKGKKNVN